MMLKDMPYLFLVYHKIKFSYDVLIYKGNLHTLLRVSSFELNIFWPVYKQHGLFPATVSSKRKINWQKELYKCLKLKPLCYHPRWSCSGCSFSLVESFLWWKTDKIQVTKINKNDSTPSRERPLVVLLTQFHKITFAFYCLVLCSELCLLKAVLMRIRYIPSPPKCCSHKALPSLL